MPSPGSAIYRAVGLKPLDVSNPIEAISRAVACGAQLEDKATSAVGVIAEFVDMLEAGLTDQEARPLVQDVGADLARLLIAVYQTAHTFRVNIDDIVFRLETSALRAFPE